MRSDFCYPFVDDRFVSKPLERLSSNILPLAYVFLFIQPQDEMGAFTFGVKVGPGHVDQQVLSFFLATLNSSSYLNVRIFIKLVSGPYSQAVQEHLTAHELAPQVVMVTVKMDGAPTAYIMEFTLTHPSDKRYINSSCQMLQS